MGLGLGLGLLLKAVAALLAADQRAWGRRGSSSSSSDEPTFLGLGRAATT